MIDRLQAVLDGCAAAHRRLEQTLRSIDGDAVTQASRLPEWSVAHVLTHLARNAESHVRTLEAALEGRSVEQYEGGSEQRTRDIEAGATRPAAELVDEVITTTAALEAAWARMTPEGWQGHGLAHGIEWPCSVLPFHRWREVELHHVDLGLGYEVEDWPEEYVELELTAALAALPDRLTPEGARSVLAWLVGRSDAPDRVELAAWQDKREYYHVLPAALGASASRTDIAPDTTAR